MKIDIERAAQIAAAAWVVLREIETEPGGEKRQRLAEALVQPGEARRIVHAELINRRYSMANALDPLAKFEEDNAVLTYFGGQRFLDGS